MQDSSLHVEVFPDSLHKPEAFHLMHQKQFLLLLHLPQLQSLNQKPYRLPKSLHLPVWIHPSCIHEPAVFLPDLYQLLQVLHINHSILYQYPAYLLRLQMQFSLRHMQSLRLLHTYRLLKLPVSIHYHHLQCHQDQ